MKESLSVIFIFFIFITLSGVFPSRTFAFEASSENYKLQVDEIDMGAIGEMRDFPGSIQNKKPILGEDSKESFGFPIPLELILIIVGGFLFLVFVYYFVVKKRLFSRQ